MSAEENKTLVRRLFEAIAADDLSVIDELVAADFIDRQPYPGQPPGPDGIKYQVSKLREGFPGYEMDVEVLVAGDAKVAWRQTFRGTHRGTFMGIPPSGNQVSETVIGIFFIRDGKAVEFVAVADGRDFLRQLGATPAGPSAG